MNVIDCRIELVQVEGRYRKEMGDIPKLARSIERLGLLQPIGIDSAYRLVFGERRLRAYQHLGRETIPARFINLDHNIEGEHDENEEREPFTTSERVAIGEAKERQLAGRKGQRTDIQLPENFPEVPKGETRDLAAQAAGFGNGKTYEQAKKVTHQAAPEIVEAMDSGALSINLAAQVADLPKEEQAVLVARGTKEILQAAKEIRAARTEERRNERLEKIVAISTGNAPVGAIAERYPVIYLDPPWRYEHAESESRAIENQYPTMSLEEIKAMDMTKVAFDDCVMFMWATSPKLADAFEVLDAWGFSYRTCAVWDKQKIGMGYYFRQQHELLLIAVKGQPPTPAPADRPSSVFSYPRGSHSAKPHEVYEIIEAMYPTLPKIEMFCRTPREGWGVWGNQSKAA